MIKELLYTGIFSEGMAAVLWLADKTRYVFIFGNEPMRRMIFYPAAFFGLLGLMLVFWSMKPVLSGRVQN